MLTGSPSIQFYPYPVSPESVQRARDARDRERAAFTAATGVPLSDDGRLLGLLMAAAITEAVCGNGRAS